MISPASLAVAIVTKNRLPMLQRAVTSVLSQSRLPDELVVVDDGSDRSTAEWIDSLAHAHPFVRVLHQRNAGVASARQASLTLASSEYVCVLDSDDSLLPGALRALTEALVSTPDLVYSPYVEVRGHLAPRIVEVPHFADNDAFVRAILRRPRVPFKHSGLTFSRTRALDAGGYDTTLPMKVDVDLVLKLLRNGARTRRLTAPLAAFHSHPGAMSNNRLRGLPVWRQLIRKYGPRSSLGQTLVFVQRAASEVGKHFYDTVVSLRPRTHQQR